MSTFGDLLKSVFGGVAEKPIILQPSQPPRGCVAISYLSWPFRETNTAGKAKGHTNAAEVVIMAESWRDLGFRVEIVDWGNRHYVPPSDCRVAIDIDRNLERWEPLLPPGCRKIFHATGPKWIDVNLAELGRLQAIRERKGVTLQPRRQVEFCRSAEIADRIVVLGNNYTASTFAPDKKLVTRIPISSAYEFACPSRRDFASAKKQFLWICSYGMVWKGLDLVLEAFAAMPDLHLTVCGRPEKEDDFFRLYRTELTETPNIKLLGWMDMGSGRFAEIAGTHAAVVHAASSEGGAGSVIHCMHAGLVPICTRETSVDLEGFGVPIRAGTVAAVQEACRKLANMSDDEVERRARAAYDHACLAHTRARFRQNYEAFAASEAKGIP
jgi:glycosyltransferase involved in cell wall biosynthesis